MESRKRSFELVTGSRRGKGTVACACLAGRVDEAGGSGAGRVHCRTPGRGSRPLRHCKCSSELVG